MPKKKPELQAQVQVTNELCEVHLGADGSIGVKAKTIREAKVTALELHRRQRKRVFSDYEYR